MTLSSTAAMENYFEDEYSLLAENKFVRLVEQKSGIVFDNVKRRELKNNITVCMREIEERSFQRYYECLVRESTGNGKQLKKLINFITINETYFFRVKEHFEILEKTALPELVKRKQKENDKRITVWSAGSSSGEEVYSIIISLLEYPGLRDNFQLDVVGTDINEDMLYLSGKGIYSGRTLNYVPPSILGKYFEPFRDRFKVTGEVKRRARFHYLNLAESFEQQTDLFGKPDIIFFRNVLIYFNRDTTRRIIESFYRLLNDGGFLFLGPSETLWDIFDKFKLLMFERAYIYRKEAKAKKVSPPSPPPVSSIPVIPSMPPVIEPVPERPDQPEDVIFPSLEDKLRIQQEEAALMIELGDYKKAGEMVDEMLRLEMGEASEKPAVLLKMTLFANQAKEVELLELVGRALASFPIFPELHFLLGRFYESRRNLKEAVTEYRKVLFIHQDYVLARERLMRVFHGRGDIVQARREARNVLDQLVSQHVKEFQYPVGETLNPARLKEFCKKILI
ncbi:MAG: hypothetical protein GY950_37530 [bacterium]|nr:hypothetical protein [bacterium]